MTNLFADNNSNNNPRTAMLHEDGNIATGMDVVESMGPSASPMKTRDQEHGVFHEQHRLNSVTMHQGMNSISEGRDQNTSAEHNGLRGGEHNMVLRNVNIDDDTLSHRSRSSSRSHGNSDRSSKGRSSSRGSSRSSSVEGSISSRRGYGRRRRRSTSRTRGAAFGSRSTGGGQNSRRGTGRRRRHRRGGSGGGISSMSSVSLSPQIGAASAMNNHHGRREDRSRSRDRENNNCRSNSSSYHQQHTPGGHNRQRSRSGTGSSSNSLSPRSKGGGDDAAAGNGELKIDISPKRRRGGGGGGSPRPGDFDLEPSKVLHVRNVGHPVTQGDLLSLLSCFGTVEKVKMFSGQALVQLPSVSIAKATMRHFEEDEEAKIGNKKIYINYSRSKSIEPREGDSSGAGGSGGSGAGGSSGGGSGGGSSSNGGHMSVLDLGRGGVGGLDMSRGGMVMMGAGGGGAGGPRGGGVGLGLGLGQAGVLGGVDGNGKGGSVQQDSNSPYGHLIMEDHAKLLGLATYYLQTYMLQGGEGAMININQREELADYQRHARHTMGLNGSGHGHGIPGWSTNPAATTAAAMGRIATNMSSGTGAFNLGYGGRSRSGGRAVASESSDRSQQSRRPPPR